ncbi:MAG: type IX secretion system membrane protein PorP/SprF [Saprospiraceae bacterium]|nr:type IX secretion system membrane protein PorP/SprF [Saprospiraceae bacterium]
MRSILTLTVFLFLCFQGSAQQQAQYTQFMYYKLGYNPGYAGSSESPCISAIVRSQWIGLEGAPQTQIVTYAMPLVNQRVGIGGILHRETVGITESITFNGIYSYRFRLGRGYVGLGLQGSIRSFRMDFMDDRLVSTQPLAIDQSIPGGTQQKFIFNAGAGVYYSGEQYYVGFSVPRIIDNNIDFGNSTLEVSRELRHFYFMGGVSIPLSDNTSLQPQILIKYVDNSPFDADFNVTLNIINKYMAGLTYRLGGSSTTGFGESLDIMLAAQISRNLLFGVSYDITLSDLKDYNTGSIEALLRFCINQAEGDEYINPRFF